mmetsp:Transcript_135853/g.307371  ORF Transcript_135853/g.307371 Transcript_135853/m.307371 type:complete len:141 (-) Transcript_135853:1501-1923(-)
MVQRTMAWLAVLAPVSRRREPRRERYQLALRGVAVPLVLVRRVTAGERAAGGCLQLEQVVQKTTALLAVLEVAQAPPARTVEPPAVVVGRMTVRECKEPPGGLRQLTLRGVAVPLVLVRWVTAGECKEDRSAARRVAELG